jgi:cytochrome c oxidase subunit 1
MPKGVRAVLVTRLHDAEPDCIELFPSPSIWPLISAIAATVFLVGAIFTPWAVVWGAIPVAIGLIGWFWPRKHDTEEHCAVERRP